MKPLDDVSRRMFPTLAAYARRQRWLGFLAIACMIFILGYTCGLTVGSYRGKVSDESMTIWGREFHQFKEDYLKHHAKALTMTKTQANDLAWKREKEKEQPHD